MPAAIHGKGYKVVASIQNFIEPKGTQELEPENVVKVFKQKPPRMQKSILKDRTDGENPDIMYELGNQYGLFMDLNHERAGFNRRENETHLEYINRLMENDFAEKSDDHAVAEFPPEVYQQRNALLKTFN